MPDVRIVPASEQRTPNEIKDALSLPLDMSLVKTRTQGGKKFSYLPQHSAKRIANEVFGYAGWSYETLACECLGQQEVTKDGKTGWHTAYRAHVRVSAAGASYDDWGYGNATAYGQTAQYETHELAMKESVSDALKRALAAFGDRFGLALWDADSDENREAKTGRPAARVGVVAREPQQTVQLASPEQQRRMTQAAAQAELDTQQAVEELFKVAGVRYTARVPASKVDDVVAHYGSLAPEGKLV